MNSANQNNSNEGTENTISNHTEQDWLDNYLREKDPDIADNGFTRSVMREVETFSAKRSRWKKPFVLTTAILVGSMLAILIAPEAFADAYHQAELKLIACYAYLSKLGLLQLIVFCIVITFFVTFGLSTLAGRGEKIRNFINPRK